MDNIHLFRKVESLKNDFQNVIDELIVEIERLEDENQDLKDKVDNLNDIIDNIKD